MILAKTHYSALSQKNAEAVRKCKEESTRVKVKRTEEEEVQRIKRELLLAQKELARMERERGQAHQFAKLISESEMVSRRHDEARKQDILRQARARARDQVRHQEEVRMNNEKEKQLRKSRIDQYSKLHSTLDPIKIRYASELDNLIRLEKCLEMRLDEKKQKVLTEKQVERIAEKLLSKYRPEESVPCHLCKESSSPSSCNCCICNCSECTLQATKHRTKSGGRLLSPGKAETNELSAILQRVLEKLDQLKMDEEDDTANGKRYENVAESNREERRSSMQSRRVTAEENETEGEKNKSTARQREEEEEANEEALDGEAYERLEPFKASRLLKEAAVNTSTRSVSSFISSESSYAQLPSPIILRKWQKASLRPANTRAKVIDESLASVESLDTDAFWHSVLRSADLLHQSP